ncbi:MAG: hypothetical protein U0M06_03490 [Clostridia bacterium]|nr:hypothetical protein [Clostridia bacterium]
MLKGCRKQMIVLHGTASEIFDEAYFILKKEGNDPKYMQNEGKPMFLEANRILEENRIREPYRSKSYYALRYSLFFILGLFVGFGSILIGIGIS